MAVRHQKAITDDLTSHARYVFLELADRNAAPSCLRALTQTVWPNDCVIGLSTRVLDLLNANDIGPQPFSTPNRKHIPASFKADIWLWFKGDDPGVLLHRSRKFAEQLAPAFKPVDALDSFVFADGRDLSGYEDGTENPTGQAAIDFGITRSHDPRKHGGSYVSVMQWQHDLSTFEAMSQRQRDDTIGRRLSDNEEFESAPLSAHVKRTEQNDYTPPIFILRRSMPWQQGLNAGLMFIAFTAVQDTFNLFWHNMLGMNDGIEDALFSFTKPLKADAYWCPPVENGRLRLP
ncbi:MAG: Dyp-type peroxidase [Gammaproteobacteria bacterium]|nr:MAG: Dyp-type peroxidase [Gammaproteobacteria bacterium]